MMKEEDDNLDPRIQVELNNLNVHSEEINKLEAQLDEAQTGFRTLLSESTRQLKLMSKKMGASIEKARPYYNALDTAREAQLECQRAAVQFQRASALHQAAKETIALAEERFLSQQGEWEFDSAWQEMLNHATIRVMEAEKQKTTSQKEHSQRAALFTGAEYKVQILEKQLRRHIIKTQPYFELKEKYQKLLSNQKERVQALSKAVTTTKQRYASALRSLEAISEEIHEKRRLSQPRLPGVGAEMEVTVNLSLPSVNLDDLCDSTGSGLSSTTLSSSTTSDVEDEGIDSNSESYNQEYWEEIRSKIESMTLDLAAEPNITQEQIDNSMSTILRRHRRGSRTAGSGSSFSALTQGADGEGASGLAQKSQSLESGVSLESHASEHCLEQRSRQKSVCSERGMFMGDHGSSDMIRQIRRNSRSKSCSAPSTHDSVGLEDVSISVPIPGSLDLSVEEVYKPKKQPSQVYVSSKLKKLSSSTGCIAATDTAGSFSTRRPLHTVRTDPGTLQRRLSQPIGPSTENPSHSPRQPSAKPEINVFQDLKANFESILNRASLRKTSQP